MLAHRLISQGLRDEIQVWIFTDWNTVDQGKLTVVSSHQVKYWIRCG